MSDFDSEPPKVSQQLYRQQALDRLNSPDQLDTPLIVPRSAAMIAVAGLVLLAATLLAWAMMGS
jgi:hypothetical protein